MALTPEDIKNKKFTTTRGFGEGYVETEVDDFLIDGGWGTWGFKAIPVAGCSMAELIATGRTPDLIAPFGPERFRDDHAVPERASAGTH